MNEFTWLFVATLALAGGIELWLTARQAWAVVAHRDQVPTAFQQRISLAAHQKAADYTLAKLRVERIEIGAGALLTLAWTLGGGLATLGALRFQSHHAGAVRRRSSQAGRAQHRAGCAAHRLAAVAARARRCRMVAVGLDGMDGIRAVDAVGLSQFGSAAVQPLRAVG